VTLQAKERLEKAEAAAAMPLAQAAPLVTAAAHVALAEHAAAGWAGTAVPKAP